MKSGRWRWLGEKGELGRKTFHSQCLDQIDAYVQRENLGSGQKRVEKAVQVQIRFGVDCQLNVGF